MSTFRVSFLVLVALCLHLIPATHALSQREKQSAKVRGEEGITQRQHSRGRHSLQGRSSPLYSGSNLQCDPQPCMSGEQVGGCDTGNGGRPIPQPPTPEQALHQAQSLAQAAQAAAQAATQAAADARSNVMPMEPQQNQGCDCCCDNACPTNPRPSNLDPLAQFKVNPCPCAGTGPRANDPGAQQPCGYDGPSFGSQDTQHALTASMLPRDNVPGCGYAEEEEPGDDECDDSEQSVVPTPTPTPSPAPCGGGIAPYRPKKAVTPVFIEIYIMSKCVDDKAMLETFMHVTKILQEWINVFVYYLVKPAPAETYKYWSMHGDSEVYGDMMEMCAAKFYPTNLKYLDFIDCAYQDYRIIPANLVNCAVKLDMDPDLLEDCAKGSQGQELLARAAKKVETNGIDESPAMRIEGTRYRNSLYNYEEMMEEICKRYIRNKPPPCDDIKAAVNGMNPRPEIDDPKDAAASPSPSPSPKVEVESEKELAPKPKIDRSRMRLLQDSIRSGGRIPTWEELQKAKAADTDDTRKRKSDAEEKKKWDKTRMNLRGLDLAISLRREQQGNQTLAATEAEPLPSTMPSSEQQDSIAIAENPMFFPPNEAEASSSNREGGAHNTPNSRGSGSDDDSWDFGNLFGGDP